MKEVKFEKGLDEEKVRKISELKNEPEWMLEYRLKSYKDFTNKPLPSFGPKINIDFNNITYYKRIDNEVHNSWNSVNKNVKKTFDDILDFHVKFERIHPFQDGNGRVGRLIMFKECLKYNIVPFIIDDSLKMFYYRGLKEWDNEKGYLRDTCLTGQDRYKVYLDYFRIKY